MIVALVPGRVIPPPKMPEFLQPVEPGRQRPQEPNVWPGMKVLLIDVHKAQLITTALQRTVPTGKVFVLSSLPAQAERLAQKFASLGDQVEVLEAIAPAALRLADQSIDRGFCAVRRSNLSLFAPMLREVHRVMKPESQLAITLDFALGGQTQQIIVDACVTAGFQQIASRRQGLQRTMIFQA